MHRLAASLFTAISILVALSGVARAEPAAHWDVWVEQDGKRVPLKGAVHLKKKPFAFIITSDAPLSYALITSVDRRDFAGVRSGADFKALIGEGNVAAEARDGTSQFLSVNNIGAIPSGQKFAQWWDDNPAARTTRFSAYGHDAKGFSARKEISEVFLASGFAKRPLYPLADAPIKTIYVLMAASQSPGPITPSNPRLSSIIFD